MALRVSGVFFESCCDSRILLDVVGARSQLSPFMTVQEFVDVIHGDILPDGFAERRVKLLSREQIPGLCLD